MFLTLVVGLPGREISPVATDGAVRQQPLALDASPSTAYLSSVLTIKGKATHRSVWASKASQQVCVDCHNRLQNLHGNEQWELGNLMAPQVVEQDVDAQLAIVSRTALIQGALAFAAGGIFGPAFVSLSGSVKLKICTGL